MNPWFFEIGGDPPVPDDVVVKVMNPTSSYEPERVILMARASAAVVRSLSKTNQKLTEGNIYERFAAFAQRWPGRIDVIEQRLLLKEENWVASQLAQAGWPMHTEPTDILTITGLRTPPEIRLWPELFGDPRDGSIGARPE